MVIEDVTSSTLFQQEYKVKEELCVSERLYAGVVEFGGIESLFVGSIEEDMQAVLFCKKEMSKYEINMLKYLMEKIKLNASNKYIVALTSCCILFRFVIMLSLPKLLLYKLFFATSIFVINLL